MQLITKLEKALEELRGQAEDVYLARHISKEIENDSFDKEEYSHVVPSNDYVSTQLLCSPLQLAENRILKTPTKVEFYKRLSMHTPTIKKAIETRLSIKTPIPTRTPWKF